MQVDAISHLLCPHNSRPVESGVEKRKEAGDGLLRRAGHLRRLLLHRDLDEGQRRPAQRLVLAEYQRQVARDMRIGQFRRAAAVPPGRRFRRWSAAMNAMPTLAATKRLVSSLESSSIEIVGFQSAFVEQRLNACRVCARPSAPAADISPPAPASPSFAWTDGCRGGAITTSSSR